MKTILWIIFCGVFIYYLTSICSVFGKEICDVINKRLKN